MFDKNILDEKSLTLCIAGLDIDYIKVILNAK